MLGVSKTLLTQLCLGCCEYLELAMFQWLMTVQEISAQPLNPVFAVHEKHFQAVVLLFLDTAVKTSVFAHWLDLEIVEVQ